MQRLRMFAKLLQFGLRMVKMIVVLKLHAGSYGLIALFALSRILTIWFA